MNCEESDIASGGESSNDSGEPDELIAKPWKVWKTSAPPVTRRRLCNIATESPGPTRITDNVNTLQQVFNYFLDDEIVEAICTYTIPK